MTSARAGAPRRGRSPAAPPARPARLARLALSARPALLARLALSARPALLALLALLGPLALPGRLAAPARAERRVHGSAGAGGALALTGARGDRARLDAAIDVKPGGRLGAILAWRGFDADHRGLAVAGIAYEAGAARPRLVLDLHAALGADLDARAPVTGGGLRGTLGLAGPLAVVLDLGGYLVIDGLDATRLQLHGSALAAVRW